jgi:hypothetical protein
LLKVGDEIMTVNNTDCTRMSRIEAWNFMKKLSDGTATLVVRQKLEDPASMTSTSTSTSASASTLTLNAAASSTTATSKTNGNQEMSTDHNKEPEKLEAKR